MTVTFEKNYLRKTYRIKLPAKVIIDDQAFQVHDWSFHGFRIDAPPAGSVSIGEEVSIRFVLAFASFDLVFNAVAELKNVGGGGAGFAFVDIPTESRMLMREYITAYVDGRLESAEGIIQAVEGAALPPELEEDLSEEEEAKNQRRFRRHALAYGVIGLLIGLAALTTFYQQRFAYSRWGILAGNTLAVRAPIAGIVNGVAVREGQAVTIGEQLLTLDDSALRDRLRGLETLWNMKKRAVDAAAAALEEEDKRQELYADVANRQQQILQSRLVRTQVERDHAIARLSRTDELLTRGNMTQVEREQLAVAVSRANALHQETSDELELARVIADQARQGRFFSGSEIQNRLEDHQQIHNNRRADLARVELEMAEVQGLIEQTEIRATRNAIVYRVHSQLGDRVHSGEPLLRLEVDHEPWVAASFSVDDAEALRRAESVSVYFPALDVSVEGVVVAVGLAALDTAAARLDAFDTSALEIPVKIRLLKVPDGLEFGLRVVVKVDVGSRIPFIPKFL